MNKNSLIGTGNTGRGLVLLFFNIIQQILFFHELFTFYFLSKRCSLKIVAPQFKNVKKDNLSFQKNPYKSTLKGAFFSKVAGLLATTLQVFYNYLVYYWEAPTLSNSSKRLFPVVVAIAIFAIAKVCFVKILKRSFKNEIKIF